MRKIIITGLLKTITPLHITAPSDMRFDPQTGKVRTGTNKDGSVPCTCVQTMGIPYMGTETDEETGVEKTYRSVAKVPAISGNNLNGHIRRHVANVFLEALADKGDQVNITTYSAIKCGAATGSPDGAPVSYEDFKKAEQHPFLGIMGGGPRLVGRKAKVWNATSICRETRALHQRNRIPYFEIYEADWDTKLTDNGAEYTAKSQKGVWGYRRNDDLKTLADISSAEGNISDFAKAFEERQTKIMDDFKNDKEDGNTKTGLDTYQGLEFVIPGTAFPFVAIMENPTDAQAGLWFRGFERFCREDALGGWSRNGFGEFLFEEGMITVIEDDEIVSSQPYNPNRLQGVEDGTFHKEAVLAWAEASRHVTGEEINKLLKLGETKKEKAEKKKAKEAAAEQTEA